MLKTTDPELSSVITNVCKPPKNFYFPEIAQPVMFVWFEEFPWVCYSCWEDRFYCLHCVLFGFKNVEKSLQQTISNMENSKNIQKSSKCCSRNTKKETNIIS